MKKLVLFLSLIVSSAFGQKGTTSLNGTNTLSGFGKFGGQKDQISLRRYNGTVKKYYAYDALFRAISNKKAAIGVTIRNDSTQSTDGKISAAHVVLRNDSLLVLLRRNYNQSLVKIFGKRNFTFPQYIKVVVDGNKLEVFSTKRTDGKLLQKQYENDTAFVNWTHKTPNLLFPVYNNVATTEIASVRYIPISDTPSSGSGGGGVTPPDTNTSVPSYYVSVSNVAKNISIQTTPNYIPLDSIGQFSAPTFQNAQGDIRPKWGVWWNFFGKYFVDANKEAWQFGLMGNANINPSFYYGNGTRGEEFIWPIDYNSGTNWPDDIDPVAGESFYTFQSTIPSYHRFFEEGLHNGQRLDSLGLEGSYDLGRSVAQDLVQGWGDNVGGKTQRGLIGWDVEDGSADYGSEVHRAGVIGMAENTTGDVSSDYGGALGSTLGYIHDQETGEKKMLYYPDSAGNYAPGVISLDWKSDTQVLSIPSRGVLNKRLIDYPNIIPSTEVSFYSHEWAKQDSVYSFGAGYSIVTNKYGVGRNTEHFFARAGVILETQSHYCRHKLNNRRNKVLTKVIADKGPIGLNPFIRLANGSFQADTDTTRRAALCGREYAFDLVSLTYMNSVDLHEWDKNSYTFPKSHDTYVGFFAAMKMLMTNGGADAYNEMVPQYWETEQSYDHINWVKHKAVDWADSPTILPCRTKVGNMKFEAMCWRTEDIEPTEVWLRANVNGVMREIHVTPNSWETTNPKHKGKALNLIPVKDKDYFYILNSY